MSCEAPAGERFRQIDAEIIEAHTRDDAARLAGLYADAARLHVATGDIDQAAFLLVNAYVWALDAGEHTIAAEAREFLLRHGREQ
jgi:hypothetical protein